MFESPSDTRNRVQEHFFPLSFQWEWLKRTISCRRSWLLIHVLKRGTFCIQNMFLINELLIQQWSALLAASASWLPPSFGALCSPEESGRHHIKGCTDCKKSWNFCSSFAYKSQSKAFYNFLLSIPFPTLSLSQLKYLQWWASSSHWFSSRAPDRKGR